MENARDGKRAGRRPPGAEPDTLKIEGDWTEAVRRAMHAPIPPGGVPEREKRKRGPNKAPKK
jgi:hypothetical protein